MRWDTEQLVIDHSHAELVQRLIAKVRHSFAVSCCLYFSQHELLPASRLTDYCTTVESLSLFACAPG